MVDTAQCAALVAAADLLIDASGELVGALRARATELIDVPVAGRTHGMHAEPTTFGAKFALWALQADRDRQRLRSARARVAVGKLSGAVGTYSNIDPSVEAYVCGALGLTPVPATQVIARDRHAEYLSACASAGATIELVATEVRHLARSEVGEAEEAFAPGQKGSSAMPHKRNPILAERLTGLARVLRGYASAGLEDVALWHERDISHSSVERVVLPDASLLTLYMLRKATSLVDGLVVHAERALENLTQGSYGLVFSQSVLLALVDAGLRRDEAYRIVQRDARAAWADGRHLKDVLGERRRGAVEPRAGGRGLRPRALPAPPQPTSSRPWTPSTTGRRREHRRAAGRLVRCPPMRFTARVEVTLRPGIADPEGATIERALPALGFGEVSGVRAGRSFRFEIEADDEPAARERAAELAHRLLANPVIEESAVELEAAGNAAGAVGA